MNAERGMLGIFGSMIKRTIFVRARSLLYAQELFSPSPVQKEASIVWIDAKLLKKKRVLSYIDGASIAGYWGLGWIA